MTYTAPDHRIRWHACRNTTTQTIPGYALMMLDAAIDEGARETAADGDASEDDQGQTIWKVRQPDESMEARDDLALLVANGPLQIPPGRRGICSWDWPLQLLHDGRAHSGVRDSISAGIAAGPRAGSWYAWRRSIDGPLTCLGHDTVQGTRSTRTSSLHTAWFAGRNIRGSRMYFSVLQNGTYYTDEVVEFMDATVPLPVSSGTRDFELQDRSSSDSSQVLLVKKAGVYEISYSLTVQGPDAPEGGLLYVDVKSTYPALVNPVSLSMPGVRAAHGPAYSDTSRENVASGGIVDLGADSKIWLENVGAYQVSVTYARFRVVQVAPDRGVVQG